MEFEHKKFGKCVLKDLTQKMLEDFSVDMKGLEREPLSVWRGAGVRSAVENGILVEPIMTVEDVENAKPSLIIWISDCVTKLIAEATSIDPLS